MSESALKLPVPPFRAFLVVFAAALAIRLGFPPLRHGIYLLPFLALVPFLFGPWPISPRQRRVITYVLRYLILFTVVALIAGFLDLARLAADTRLLKEIFFLLAPAFTAVAIICYMKPAKHDVYAGLLFWLTVAVFLSLKAGDVFNALRNPSVLASAWRTSILPTESGMAFIFGLFSLYFLFNRRHGHFLLATLALVLSFKRVAILGVVFAALAYGALRFSSIKLPRYRDAFAALAVLINLAVVYLLWRLTFGDFDATIEQHLGVTTNFLLQGRQGTYAFLLRAAAEEGWLGLGLGETTALLASADSRMGLLHSDVLKFFLELGPVVFIILFYSLYRINTGSVGLFSLMIYLNVLFLTDNVAIYFEVMFCFYVIAALLLAGDEESRRVHLARAGGEGRRRGDEHGVE